jgi:hypothetical protein
MVKQGLGSYVQYVSFGVRGKDAWATNKTKTLPTRSWIPIERNVMMRAIFLLFS